MTAASTSAPIARRGRGRESSILALLGLALLPNVGMRVLELSMNNTARLVNLDYLAVAFLAPLLGRWRTALALALALFFDLVTIMAPAFHFEVADVLPAVGEVFAARPLVWIVIAVSLTAVLVGVSYALLRLLPSPATGMRARLTLIVVGISLLLADALNGSGHLLASRRAYLPFNIAGSALLENVMAVAGRNRRTDVDDIPVTRVESATSPLLARLRAGDERATGARHVVLVIVESLARFRSDAVHRALMQTLDDSALARRYDVRTGDVPFLGATTAGEFRELCGEQRTFRNAPSAPRSDCLPQLLRAAGFRTFALHGFRETLFDRARWYPLVGFDSIVGERAMRQQGISESCGTIFRGICDREAAEVVRRTLAEAPASERRFVYWLTLSAHFPVDESAIRAVPEVCASTGVTDETLCLLMRVWATDLASLRAIAMDPGLPPTRFIVVGDHQPPLGARQLEFFVPGIVPYIELLPRGGPSARQTPDTAGLPAP